MNARSTNYLHPSAELRARAQRETADRRSREATAITFTLPTAAAIALAEDAENRAGRAQVRADDEGKADDVRAFWRQRAGYWNGVAQTIVDALNAERVSR